MKFYDFVDKRPAIGKLVVIEGTERVLADRALEILTQQLLAPEVRELNLQRFSADDAGDFTGVREAVAAMPFLADRRVTVVTEAQTLKAPARRDLLAAAQTVPDGNTLVITDLVSPRSKRPEPLGSLAGRGALRIDTSAAEDARGRFVVELLAELGAKAEPRAIDALVRSAADLTAVRNDLEKLALVSKKITVRDLEREALSIEDPKSYHYASALVEGRVGEALAIAHEILCQRAARRHTAVIRPGDRMRVSLGVGQAGRGTARTAALARTAAAPAGPARRPAACPARLRARTAWDRSGRDRPRRQ